MSANSGGSQRNLYFKHTKISTIMKKWFYLMLVAVLPVMAASLASCNDDDDLPNVDISLTVDKGTVVDGTIYGVVGDTIQIASINVVNNEAGKAATVTNVNYYWDGVPYGPSAFSPFGMTFPIPEDMTVGDYQIGITATVLAVDKSIAVAALTYPVKIVASADEIPSTATGQSITNSAKLSK